MAVQLVGGHVNSTVNNPIEAVAHWRAGKLRPLCVFDDKRMPYKQKVTDTMSWGDIPTCMESGVKVDYLMLRGIFMPGGVSQDQVNLHQPVQAGARAAGVEGVHGKGRVQPELHDRQGIRRLGGKGRGYP